MTIIIPSPSILRSLCFLLFNLFCSVPLAATGPLSIFLLIKARRPRPRTLLREPQRQSAKQDGLQRRFARCQHCIAGRFIFTLELKGERHNLLQRRRPRIPPPGPLKAAERGRVILPLLQDAALREPGDGSDTVLFFFRAEFRRNELFGERLRWRIGV